MCMPKIKPVGLPGIQHILVLLTPARLCACTGLSIRALLEEPSLHRMHIAKGLKPAQPSCKVAVAEACARENTCSGLMDLAEAAKPAR